MAGAARRYRTGLRVELLFEGEPSLRWRWPVGFFFFALALYFARTAEVHPLVVTGHIKIADTGGLLVRLKSEDWPMPVSSDGEIYATVQPMERLAVQIEAPGYKPARWYYALRPEDEKNGRVEIHLPEFTLATGTSLTQSKFEKPPRLPADP